MALFRQTNTLTKKTLRIIIARHTVSTILSAFVLPVIASLYLGLGQKINNPDDKFGIGPVKEVLPLKDALSKAHTHRDTVALVNSGHSGGEIDRVLDSISDVVTGAGKNATRISNEDELGYVCRSTIRGTSNCYGAVVFYSSPDEGSGGIWNYTLRADGGLGLHFRVDENDNDAEIYTMPLQHAVDASISGSGSAFPSTVHQYAYTAETEDDRKARVLREYQRSFIDYLSVAFVISLIGVCYHMPGQIATEREVGLSQLIDAMMPVNKGWHKQFARLVSHQNAFIITYLPGWILASLICRALIWKHTSVVLILLFFILSGFAITSMSLLGACFWRRAQMSGFITAVVWIALGIVAQVIPDPGTTTVAILGLLFTPCNFVYFITYVARYEQNGQGASLRKPPEDSPWQLPGGVLWIFLILQCLMYPFIAVFLERALHGVTTGVRSQSSPERPILQDGDVVRVENVTKIYQPSLLSRLFSFISLPRAKVLAVDNLTFTAQKGHIIALLGANGSGKSTTLDIIAGISNFTSGVVSVDAKHGLGIAPQKNVLWDDLTVEEHIKIFNRLKSPQSHATKKEIRSLIRAIGLGQKRKSLSKTLSGGQKRKLQLGMMLTGGSSVCCIDEVSSGVDPLSRRKIWDILLSERGNRTIIMTTHFLDEADLLADNIAILSKGKIRAQGSSAQLKNTFGTGYRVHVINARHMKQAPDIPHVQRKELSNSITYVAQSSRLAAEVIETLEHARIPYQFSGPTIEDVFLELSEEVRDNEGLSQDVGDSSSLGSKEKFTDSDGSAGAKTSELSTQGLHSGHPVSMAKQVFVFLRKRTTVLKKNWMPYAIAFFVPIVAASITQMLVNDKPAVGCSPGDRSSKANSDSFSKLYKSMHLVGGPLAMFNASAARSLTKLFPEGAHIMANQSFKLVDSLSGFKSYVESDHQAVSPGGWWLGDAASTPTMAFRADNFSLYTSVLTQNLMNNMLANLTIVTKYNHFDFPIAPSTLDALQLVIYFCIACSIFPGIFGLYPNFEKRQQLRALQYSSGARTVPVWAAHLIFDICIMLVSMAIVAIVFATTSQMWYQPAYLFPVFFLYAVVTILWSYVFSLICNSSLATYAATAALQGLGFAVYMITFLCIITFSEAATLDHNLLLSHWIISIIFPTGSLIRAFFVGLNTFSTTCDGDKLQSDPGTMTAYGGPILYLAIQSIILFFVVIWVESGRGRHASGKVAKSAPVDDTEVANEIARVDGDGREAEGLHVMHLAKSFKKNTVVDNVTFGVGHGEVFALLGPNGAGKSTTISLIRGDLHPSRNGGDVFIEKASITKKRAVARQNLGVCPQFDAIDLMTVEEHLQHFARIRGTPKVDEQVQAVIRAVGLEAYSRVMAHTLSGGNKRKLSLGIALTGNPSVILLDEPSSGLDAAAKRVMWRTLESIIPGRSILLTTHSMEEADALANRAGIMAKRILAIGSTESLRHRFGDTLHVHLVSKTAPHSTAQEMHYIKSWILDTFPQAEVDNETYYGQLRYSIPASSVRSRNFSRSPRSSATESAIGRLLVILEAQKDHLGIAHYSVSPTTLNEVFLRIVSQHDVQEEGHKEEKRSWWR